MAQIIIPNTRRVETAINVITKELDDKVFR